MLAMQREAWEQGVAMQALLEWGDRDAAVRMAHGAILRIYEDGRLGMVSDNHGVTDPAANGEGVLFAAKETGDPGLQARGGPDARLPDENGAAGRPTGRSTISITSRRSGSIRCTWPRPSWPWPAPRRRP
ncbi:MAG: hypothetical protein M0C28_39100 [Candidatus Moduliflexus flocculans]|nr:hypothetical protein [Candidatus Moduliflexus flocculans]